ncbi:hypothetical protein HZH68_001604 [Vespula germanica]|uniref:Uncharacterized protein n=1 Tax=Vespula germanica TaxID=30212 RepID=A0A834U700_VESGE|nr:hypothetical protein HZH68_001604 [Vespula germanica]
MSIARDKFNGRRTSNHLEAKFPWKADWGSASKLPGPLRFLAHHCRYSRNSEATTPLSFVTFTSRSPLPTPFSHQLLTPPSNGQGSSSPTLTPLSIGAFKRKIQKYTKPKPIPQLSSSSAITDDYNQGIKVCENVGAMSKVKTPSRRDDVIYRYDELLHQGNKNYEGFCRKTESPLRSTK